MDFNDVRGQGYDGAGAMSGSEKGAASRIFQKYPKSCYVHCYCHRLNLSLMKVTKVDAVRDVFDSTRVIADFFKNSPKRSEFLESVISKAGTSITDNSRKEDEKMKKPINICRTR